MKKHNFINALWMSCHQLCLNLMKDQPGICEDASTSEISATGGGEIGYITKIISEIYSK